VQSCGSRRVTSRGAGAADAATGFVGNLMRRGGLEGAEVNVAAIFWLLDASRWTCEGVCVIYL